MRLQPFICAAALTAGAFATAGPAAAQWPERAVTIIVPFPAGGGTDIFARPLARQLSSQLGRAVVIDNKGGAGGTVGASAAARARPDGYTFFMGGAHHALAPSLYKKLGYDIEQDFIPVALLAQPPQVVVINSQRLPVKSLAELIDYARQRPGEINYGTAGKGSTHHLAGELFALQTGIKLVDVPYQGAGPALSALIGGQVELAFDGLGSSAGHIRSGVIRPLAVAAEQRSASFPNVPTAAQEGVPDYQVSTWYALWAPAGTPDAVVQSMTAQVGQALNSPSIREIWLNNGSDVPDLTGAQLGQFVASEIKRWARVVQDSGTTLD